MLPHSSPGGVKLPSTEPSHLPSFLGRRGKVASQHLGGACGWYSETLPLEKLHLCSSKAKHMVGVTACYTIFPC